MTTRIVAAILLLCQLLGLGPGLTAARGELSADGVTALSGEEPTVAPADTLRVVMPSGQQELGNILGEIAEAEGIPLEVDILSGEGGYVPALVGKYAEAKPDIYWVRGEADAQELFNNDVIPDKMRTNEAELAIYTLARMTPAQTRILDPRQVYGLPVGLVAEGTLVNLEQIASLLGTKDQAALQRDLTFCSWEEWAALCEALQSYLERPADIEVSLAGREYTMPRYRPENAKLQRGLYAMATGQPDSLLQNTLTAAFATAYADLAALLTTTPEEMAAIMNQPLQAVFGRLEQETRYMTQAGSPLSRGEGFEEVEKISVEASEKLFKDGISLFMKGDTRTGLRLEAENPALEGKLVLIPNKLPLEDENVAVTNEMFGIATAGNLCVSESSTQKEAAFSLLTALFTSGSGQKAIERRLHLACFSSPYPKGGLQSQLMDALSYGNVYPLPATAEDLTAMATVMGQWTSGELMSLDEWGEEQQSGFVSMAQGAMSSLGLSRTQ